MLTSGMRFLRPAVGLFWCPVYCKGHNKGVRPGVHRGSSCEQYYLPSPGKNKYTLPSEHWTNFIRTDKGSGKAELNCNWVKESQKHVYGGAQYMRDSLLMKAAVKKRGAPQKRMKRRNTRKARLGESLSDTAQSGYGNIVKAVASK